MPGYLVSTRTIGKAVCFKVLVDETLRFAPQLLIANAGRASDPVPGLRETYQRVDPRKRTKTNRVHSKREVKIYIGSAPSTNSGPPESKGAKGEPVRDALESSAYLRGQLASAEPSAAANRPSIPVSRATVIQACKRPPTSANEETIEHALEWVAPLRKPERIENAPNVESLRRELQLFYLERSRAYDWARLPWDEIVLTGVMLGPDGVFEEEIVGGVDLVPYLVAIHDPQRDRWLVLDLTFNDGVAKEVMLQVLQKQVPGLLGRAAKGF